MKTIITAILLTCILPSFSQTMTVKQLHEFVENADMECYRNMIQKDMEDYNKWLRDSFALVIKNNIESHSRGIFTRPYYSESKIDLKKEHAIYLLCICLFDMKDFSIGDNIYDHIIIDSMYTFTAAIVDHHLNWIGLTDNDDKGSYMDFNDKGTFYFDKSTGPYLQDVFKTIYSHEPYPDFFLFCRELWELGNHRKILYAKNDSLYLVDENDSIVEFNKYVKKRLVRASEINYKVSRLDMRLQAGDPRLRSFWKRTDDDRYKIIGNTKLSEMRICQIMKDTK